MMEKHNCEECKMRTKYDTDPKSLVSRFWRWHINWCPGWKAYMNSLSEIEKDRLKNEYQLR